MMYPHLINDLDIKRVNQTITARPVKGGHKLRIGSTIKYAAPEFGTKQPSESARRHVEYLHQRIGKTP